MQCEDETTAGRWLKETQKGYIGIAPLILLSKKPYHGYEIMREIKERTMGFWRALSMGTLDENIVTCPQHFSRFDLITGKMVSGPVEITGSANIFEKCLEEAQKTISQLVQRQREIQKSIKTYDQPTYEVRAQGNDILVRV